MLNVCRNNSFSTDLKYCETVYVIFIMRFFTKACIPEKTVADSVLYTLWTTKKGGSTLFII